MKTKRCSGCKETKPVSEFNKDRNRKDGLAHSCRECRREYRRRYREANIERLHEYERRYRDNNKEKDAEKQRRYREANKEKLAEAYRKYRESNKEKIAERKRKWRSENKELVREHSRKRYRENKHQLQRNRARHVKEMNESSLELAHRQGLPWEDWEDEFILTDNGLTWYQKAVKLGRSFVSVTARKNRLRKKAKNELTTDTVRV